VVDGEKGLWPVLCDRAQLDQVLLNLALNARDAMPGGGRLTFETGNVRINSADPGTRPGLEPGEWVRLVVRDQGTGMTPAVKAHLFEPFFTTKEHGKGTGLGLATVYGIVTQSGGHIFVDSAPGRGTTFEIHLPRTTRSATPTAAHPEPARLGGTERVLVIEDDAQVRSVTVRALEGAGYRVLVARGPEEALELAARERDRIDLVVADVVMPGMSGWAVVDQLKLRIPRLRSLHVSGYPQDRIARAGSLDLGIHFLPKPFTSSALLERVRRVLDAEE